MTGIVDGATVMLKSGGPLMTVIYLTAGSYSADDAPKDKAYCQWFNGPGGKPESDTFPLTALKLVDLDD